MKNNMDELDDNEVRVIGEYYSKKEGSNTSKNGGGIPRKRKYTKLLYLLWLLTLLIVTLVIILFFVSKNEVDTLGDDAARIGNSATTQKMVEPATVLEPIQKQEESYNKVRLGEQVEEGGKGYTEMKDTVVNEVPMRLFFPHNAHMSLHIGPLSMKDKSIVYAALAADIRADNGGIVGAYVVKGIPKSWGLSKKGFCACIDGNVTVGVADNSPLFEEATDKKGYFFRQYPLVDKGQPVESNLKAETVRRAICERNGEIFMVETQNKQTFQNFSQALVDLGVDNAIYLIGSAAHGWAVDKNNQVYEFGLPQSRRKMPRNVNYIVWRKNR